MFLLAAGRAQSRSRADESIRTQRDHSRSRDQIETHRSSKHRSKKESDSSNNYAPIIVGPLTTNQDLADVRGEKIYNLPLMIQQPFLRERKEPIKVDISVKLIPKPRKKEKRKRNHREFVEDEDKVVKNTISMEVSGDNINVLKETLEIIDDANDRNDIDTRSFNNNDAHEIAKIDNLKSTPKPQDQIVHDKNSTEIEINNDYGCATFSEADEDHKEQKENVPPDAEVEDIPIVNKEINDT